MGFMRHHAIIVTGGLEEITKPHEKAKEIFPQVSEVLPGEINSYGSFFIPPDGSKEGWEDSKIGDRRREEFINWIRSEAEKVGYSKFETVELFYCDDNKKSGIVNAIQ